MLNPPYQIELSDASSHETWGLKLDGGASALQVATMSDEQFGLYIRAVGKKIGDFDEQRDWKGGRGRLYLSDDSSGYWDGMNAWTLSPNQLHPTLQWRFARGLRNADSVMPSSGSAMKWQSLIGTTRYKAVAFAASASYSAVHIVFIVRRRGVPGTLTAELCSQTSSSPGAVLQTKTVTTTTITDTISVYHDFVITAEALTSGTTYWVKLYGASTDDANNHWEVLCSASSGKYSTAGSTWTADSLAPFYRVTDADTDRRFFMCEFDDAMYAVDSKASGAASQLYINGDRGIATSATATTLVDSTKTWTADRWIGAYVKIVRGTGVGQVRAITDNDGTSITVATWTVTPDATSEYVFYGTDWFTEITGHGFGKVVSRPVVAFSKVYFPQGESVAIRRVRWSAGAYTWAADSTNMASFMRFVYDSAVGARMARINNAAATVTVSFAPINDAATDLAFGTAIGLGEANHPATGSLWTQDQLYVYKRNTMFAVKNDKATMLNYGLDATPSAYNGIASASLGQFIYFSWLSSTQQYYAGSITDVGEEWKGQGLPSGRQSYDAHYEPVVGWLFISKDAGAGTSSVICWDGLSRHEVLRGWSAGRRIRETKWQPCEGTRSRLWTDIGGELIFQEFPEHKANPLYDSGANYQHEGVIESATIDMGAASNLPKFIRSVTALTENLASGISVELDYQVDNDCNTTSWTPASADILKSPEDTVMLNIGNIRKFNHRLRMQTNDASNPPVVRGVIPSGFARVPFRRTWTMRVLAGDIFTPAGTKATDPNDLIDWLYSAASYPGKVIMYSIYNVAHEFFVIVAPPSIYPQQAEISGQYERDTITVSLMET